MRVVAGLLVLATLAGCGSERPEPSSAGSPPPGPADYDSARQAIWDGVDWTFYVAPLADTVCAEWTGVAHAGAPVTYPSSLDLERRSCIERDVLTQAKGTVVQPMFSYRLPNDRVGVWGVTAPEVVRLDLELASGEQPPSLLSGDGTFALLLDEDSQAGEVVAVLSDGTTVGCTEPASLSEFASTCR